MKSQNWKPITKLQRQLIVSAIIVVILFVLNYFGLQSKFLPYLFESEILTQMPLDEALYLLVIFIVGYITPPKEQDKPVEK